MNATDYRCYKGLDAVVQLTALALPLLGELFVEPGDSARWSVITVGAVQVLSFLIWLPATPDGAMLRGRRNYGIALAVLVVLGGCTMLARNEGMTLIFLATMLVAGLVLGLSYFGLTLRERRLARRLLPDESAG